MTEFRVKLDKIRYKNDQLFTIAVAHSDEEVPEKYRNKGLIHQLTLKGYFPPNMSTKYLVNGDFEKNKYGFTFLVKQYEEIKWHLQLFVLVDRRNRADDCQKDISKIR